MSQILRPELLPTLKDSLRDLENISTASPHDPHLVQLKQNLRRRIAELESGPAVPTTRP